MNKKLINHINTLRTQHIKKLVTADAYTRGMNYHRNGFVDNFSWSDDGSILRSLVSGTDDYMVRFELSDDTLKSTCTCPSWNIPGPNCKHVAASLFTIIHSQDAKQYTSNMLAEGRMHRLRNQLTAGQQLGPTKKLTRNIYAFVPAGKKVHFEFENEAGAFKPLPDGVTPLLGKRIEISRLPSANGLSRY